MSNPLPSLHCKTSSLSRVAVMFSICMLISILAKQSFFIILLRFSFHFCSKENYLFFNFVSVKNIQLGSQSMAVWLLFVI